MTEEQIKKLARALAALHEALPDDGRVDDAQEEIDYLCWQLGGIYNIDLSDLEPFLDE